MASKPTHCWLCDVNAEEFCSQCAEAVAEREIAERIKREAEAQQELFGEE